MENTMDLSIAIDKANRKIAELNMKIINKNAQELKEELNKWLTIKEEIYKGNNSIIEKVIDNRI